MYFCVKNSKYSFVSAHPSYIERFRGHYFPCFIKIATDLHLLYEVDDVISHDCLFLPVDIVLRAERTNVAY